MAATIQGVIELVECPHCGHLHYSDSPHFEACETNLRVIETLGALSVIEQLTQGRMEA